ncbi:hypothetical protein C8Q76DRAFT_625279 [Earliella scabrosa]|nr:hypothetical protein C8Q76DRAFT_625279 [Earliella scabrosa]
MPLHDYEECFNVAFLDLNLTARKELRDLHQQFDQVYEQLTTAYADAAVGVSQGLEKYDRDVIVGILVVDQAAQMCADTMLANKLFSKGFFNTIVIPLLLRLLRQLEPPMHFLQVLLRALAIASSRGGLDLCREVAKYHTEYVKIAVLSDDPKLFHLSMVLLSHSSRTVVRPEGRSDYSIIPPSAVPNILDVAMATFRKDPDTISYGLLMHAMDLLITSTEHCPEQCKLDTSLIPFLAALTRSRNIAVRANALAAIIRITVPAEDEPEHGPFYPHLLLASLVNGMPRHLSAALSESPQQVPDMVLMLSALADHKIAMEQAELDQDMISLGRKLAALSQMTEWSIFERHSTRDESSRNTLLFPSWHSALALCALALRANDTPADLDAADVIEIKSLLQEGRYTEATKLGEAAISRNPHLAYAHYAISMGVDPQRGLRAAKEGLACADTTPFVRSQLLRRATIHAAKRGFQYMCNFPPEPHPLRREAMSIFSSALEDVDTFVTSVSPDNFWLSDMLNWNIVLNVVLNGSHLSDRQLKFQDVQCRIALCVDMQSFIGHRRRLSHMDLVRESIIKAYRSPVREWVRFVSRFDGLDVNYQAYASHLMGLSVQAKSTDLFSCTWCASPSAVLKKCARCGRDKYCGPACQKAHWEVHKVGCRETVP